MGTFPSAYTKGMEEPSGLARSIVDPAPAASASQEILEIQVAFSRTSIKETLVARPWPNVEVAFTTTWTKTPCRPISVQI